MSSTIPEDYTVTSDAFTGISPGGMLHTTIDDPDGFRHLRPLLSHAFYSMTRGRNEGQPAYLSHGLNTLALIVFEHAIGPSAGDFS